MKIQCDVCNHEPATLFCCADEAALCSSCDRHIHRANKLSIKHHRLPFLTSSPPPPLCDICQEKRAFIFCQQDRAIICQDCDTAIHTTNHLTENHSRFLLTGIRLSSSPADQPEKHTNTTSTSTSTSTSSSFFSDYLIKTLPGWQVEDLLIDDAAEAAAASHFQVEDLADEIPSWAAPLVPQSPAISSAAASAAAVKQVNSSHSKRRASDDAFRVPQLSSTAIGGQNKRQRTTTLAPSPSSFSSPLFWYR